MSGKGSSAKGGGTRRVDPADRAQLAESPVKLSRVLGLFSPYRARLFLLVLIVVAASVISLAQPFLMRSIIDDALPQRHTQLLILDTVGLVGVAVITSLLAVIQTWFATEIGNNVMHSLRVRVFEHLQAQSMAFFKRTRGGEIQSRLLQDVAGMQGVMTSVATSIAANFTTVVATAAAMVALNWRLSLISLVILPPSILATRRVALIRRDITGQRQRMLADMHGQVDEALSVNGAQLMKTLGIGKDRLATFADTSRDLTALVLRSQLAGRWRMATMQNVFAAVPAVIYLAAGFRETSGDISIGSLVAFTALQTAIFKPIMGLLNVGADWVSSMAMMSRIFGYLDLPIEVPPPVEPIPFPRDRVQGHVAFANVFYRYPDGVDLVLNDLSVTVPAGHSLALVGETGSGKSTVGTLLCRLADPIAGRITIDGIDLRDIAPEDLAAVVGVVSQETYLTHASILENLRQAKADATAEEMWEALAAAQVDDVVAALPEGLETVVGARGHRFSGGERQRIAIARTLLRNPRVLLLDEATSALDTETEHELQVALDKLIVGRTTITIAHRLSTIQDADEILVLDKGVVAERGKHRQLLEIGGVYANLARTDVPLFIEEDDDGWLPRHLMTASSRAADQDDDETVEDEEDEMARALAEAETLVLPRYSAFDL